LKQLYEKQQEMKQLFENKFIEAVKEKEAMQVRMETEQDRIKESHRDEVSNMQRQFNDEREAFKQKITIHQDDIKALIEQK